MKPQRDAGRQPEPTATTSYGTPERDGHHWDKHHLSVPPHNDRKRFP